MYLLFGIEKPEEKVEEPKDFPVTYAMIKEQIGWSYFCDVTGNNHYAINEFGDFEKSHIFYITKTQYNTLWN